MSFLSKLGKGLAIGGSIAASFVPGGGVASQLASKAGMFGKIANVAGKVGQVAGPLGAVMGSMAKSSATNRGSQIDALLKQQEANRGQTNDYLNTSLRQAELDSTNKQRMFDDLIARSQEGRASGNDAFTNLMRTDQVLNGRSAVPDDGSNPYYHPDNSPATGAVKTGLEAYRQEAMSRLTGGNPIAAPGGFNAGPTIDKPAPFTVPENLTHGGTLETLGGAAGAGLTMWDLLNRRRMGQPDYIGDAVPNRNTQNA